MEVFQRSILDPAEDWFDFLGTLARQAAIAIDNATLFENLQRSNLDLSMAYDATIEGWSHALDLRDKETEGHTLRVTEMTVQLARLSELREQDLVQVRRGALLHDIGKMGVPDRILHKPDSLDGRGMGGDAQTPIFALRNALTHPLPAAGVDIPYCHHEKWDGSGYPRGLKGQARSRWLRAFLQWWMYGMLKFGPSVPCSLEKR